MSDAFDKVDHEIADLAKHSPDTPVAPAHGIAAIALSMALKFHDTNTIKDGTLYQQFKLEGRNIRDLNLDTVFETALRIEAHLLGSSDRIAKLIIDALEAPVEDEPGETPNAEGADEAVNADKE